MTLWEFKIEVFVEFKNVLLPFLTRKLSKGGVLLHILWLENYDNFCLDCFKCQIYKKNFIQDRRKIVVVKLSMKNIFACAQMKRNREKFLDIFLA